ncbi:MAG: hypothetical protein JKY65_14510 [Planctomycetes bacterium]|nr:hypothetical protein [Planctomycetota bacterium]
MRIPKFWQRASQQTQTPAGHSWLLSAWGWSDESDEAASASAQERLKAQASAVAAGRAPDRYPYAMGERPLREEVLDRPCEGTVITRNAYGARILNTEQVAFVDVDFAPPKAKAKAGFFASLFGGGGGGSPTRQETVDETVDLLRTVLEPARVSARVYETHSGLRLLLTDRLYEPATQATQALLKSLGCDPLYLTLCREQKCFRARLTPKPWRFPQDSPYLGPPQLWPYATPEVERVAGTWVEAYEAASEAFATTRLVTTLGGRDVHPDVRPVVELHDEVSRATKQLLPLA